jgi:starch synthase
MEVDGMNILFVAAECTPFVKIGGLADVVGSLPQELKRLRRCEVRVLLPNYAAISAAFRRRMESVATFEVSIGRKQVTAGLLTLRRHGVRYYFIDNSVYFDRDRVYDYSDEAERFAFFQIAAIEAVSRMDGFFPDIIHVHDWHAAMIPYLIRTRYNSLFPRTRTVLTIHNLAYQGIFPLEDHALFGIGLDNRFEYDGCLNFLKCGIVSADAITTVSRTYAAEIMTEYYGHGMHNLLKWRANDVRGIMNGISGRDFDPRTDSAIPARYGEEDVASGKAVCREVLLKRFNLPLDSDMPVVGIVSRLVGQKGFDLVECVLEEMLEKDNFLLVVLGDGEKKYTEYFRRVAFEHPGRVAVVIGYDDRLARMIYAGADLFLMPSKFEPCGLGQLIAMRYGTLPLVRETGGLVDSVRPYNEYEETGTGFSFRDYNAHDMMYVLRYAFSVFSNRRASWNAMVKRAMAADFSWETSAREYKKFYHKILRGKGA